MACRRRSPAATASPARRRDMATFIPPVINAASADAPRRGVVDDTGHRTALIARFNGANVRAVAPCRAFAKPIEVAGRFTGAEPAGERFWFLELSPLPTAAAAALAALG